MKKGKLLLAGMLAAAMCLCLTACSTSVGENTRIYFTQTKTILGHLFSGSGTSPAGKPTQAGSTGTKLEAPSNFSIDENGIYTFTGSEGAAYYLLYFCAPDAVDDEDSFLYSSSPISDLGSGATYTGRCLDLLDCPYDRYLVKVYAFPDLTDTERAVSPAAATSYVYSGEQSAPEVYYYWDTFNGVTGIQVNVDAYIYEAYPDRVDVTFTNVDDASDVVTATIEGLAPDHYGMEIDTLTRDATYDVTAVAFSSSEYVTNPTSDTTVVAEGLTLGEYHQFTYGYIYDDHLSDFRWPIVEEHFDLSGGAAGYADTYLATNVAFTAIPAETSSGSAYSYALEIVGRRLVNGQMELYPDGTFYAIHDARGTVEVSSIKGLWYDNGDGTATLVYDHRTIETY